MKLRRTQMTGFRDPQNRWGWQSIYYYASYSNVFGNIAKLRTHSQVKNTRFMFRMKKLKMKIYGTHDNRIMVYYAK